MNKVILTGGLTRDPELKYGQSGKAYTKFSLGVRKNFGEGSDYLNCTAFGKTAELIGEYCRKGSQVLVDGEISTGSRETEKGKVYFTGIIVGRVEFLSKKNPGSNESVSKAPEPVNNFDDDEDDSDFPF